MIKEEFQKLIEECEAIASRWDGDNDGYAEEQARIAIEIVEKSKEIIKLINELNGTNN